MCSCAGSRTLARKRVASALTMGSKCVRTRSDCPRGPEWWASGKHESLSPWTQAKVFVLATASRQKSLGLSDTGIANEVFQVGGGHPGHTAIANLRGCFNADPDWYPGKKAGSSKRPGPPPLFTPQKKQALTRAAMALKRAGEEPKVAAVTPASFLTLHLEVENEWPVVFQF